MKVKHKIVSDYQFVTTDKKIITIKSGTIIEDFIFKTKSESIKIDRDIIDNNPQYFQVIDWKFELLTYLKQNKIPQPAVLSKKLIPFIEETFIILTNSIPSIDEDEYKIRLKELKDREGAISKEYESKLDELSEKEMSLQHEYESKLNEFESFTKEYYDKMKEVLDREKLINEREDSIKKEIDEFEDLVANKKAHKELLEKVKEIESMLSDYHSNVKTLPVHLLNNSSEIRNQVGKILDKVKNINS